ncbi:MAG TPA: cysteine peptidase family C39 domain-containing protein [Candidatus Portnoybacteria bacterium]|nr:cysteine peptidase family C39 domain-containing protein [Candidatus Portnoybacteria bacterium]
MKQQPGFCGVTSLKMVFDYLGLSLSEDRIKKITGANAKIGTPLAGIKKAVGQLGLKIMIKDNADFKDVAFWLNKNLPVIVGWFSQDEGHYSVVVGLDAKNIYLLDPEFGQRRKISRIDFKRTWFDFEGEAMRSKSDLILRRLIVIRSAR